MYVFIGCAAAESAPSIYLCDFDEAKGSLALVRSYNAMTKSAYMAVDAGRQIVYVVGMEGPGDGVAASYQFDPSTADLQLISKQSTLGANPNYVSTDPAYSTLFAANYGGESISVHPVKPGGVIESASRFLRYEGSSIVSGPQNKPHPHCIIPDPSNRFAIVADLGTDLVHTYEIDYARHDLTLHRTVTVTPGSGPRHLIFHQSNGFAYMINELSCTITVFSYDASIGKLEEVQTISTLPAGYDGATKCADIQISPCGSFVYGTNRGHDSIVSYRVQADGTLTYLEHSSAQGEKPRSIAISPNGEYLLVANEGSNQLVIFDIESSGKLDQTGKINLESSPICIKFMV